MNAHSPSISDELNAALAWWEMAGVTYDFAADATDWLGKASASTPAPVREAAAETAPAASHDAQDSTATVHVERVDLLGDEPPSDLAAFATWWLEAPGLDAIGPRGRVSPRGAAEPEVMILAIDPEEGDTDQLFSGPQGNLLRKMLRAMGVEENDAYFASALPRHTPMADISRLAARGMDAVTLHHIGLVRPRRLLAFGKGILPLLGHASPNEVSYSLIINQDSRSTPVLISEGLDSLLTMPQLKARFWRRWMEWSCDG